MAFNTYNRGTKVRVSAPFTLVSSGAALDPDVVKLSVKTPAGVVTTYTYGTDAEVVRDSVGNYHADLEATESGTWYYRWFATGNGMTGDEERFEVRVAQAVEEA